MRRSNLNVNRKMLYVILGVVLILVLSLTLAYAVLNVTLNITGNAEVAAANWNIHLANPVVNDASVTNNVPTISGTSLSFSTTLNIPGDFYEFTVDVVNSGSVDAIIDSIVKTNNLTDEQSKYMNFTIEYANGTVITNKQQLAADSSLTLKVRVEYRKDISASDLPSSSSTVQLSFNVICLQSNAIRYSDINGNEMYGVPDSSTVIYCTGGKFNAVPGMTLYDAISEQFTNMSGYGVDEYYVYDSDADYIFINDDGKRLNLKKTVIEQGKTYVASRWNVAENITEDNLISGNHNTVLVDVSPQFGYPYGTLIVPIFIENNDTYIDVAHAVFPNWYLFANASTIAQFEQEIISEYVVGYPAGQSTGCTTTTSHYFFAFLNSDGEFVKMSDSANHMEELTTIVVSISQDEATFEEVKEELEEEIATYISTGEMGELLTFALSNYM